MITTFLAGAGLWLAGLFTWFVVEEKRLQRLEAQRRAARVLPVWDGMLLEDHALLPNLNPWDPNLTSEPHRD